MKKFLCLLLVLGLLGCANGNQTAGKGRQAQTFMEQGLTQMQQRHYDAAIASFGQAAALQPQSAVAHNLLGMAYRFKYNQVRSQELKDKEIAAFQKAVEADPNYWVALINLGVSYYFIGEKAKAAPLFRRALELNPNHPEKEQILTLIAEGEKQ
ncbi:MAG: tetratricopeptide repeat protein [Deltaproteobacteria bacterium]|nr:tetratricopeptide repeat protein [Deltaproteobacteria bacterium]